jgi:palmitoyl-protein thioesterase
MENLKKRLPGIFIHSVQIGETEDQDRESGYFGQLAVQIDAVCKQLASIEELKNGFNAIGLSQVCFYWLMCFQEEPEKLISPSRTIK